MMKKKMSVLLFCFFYPVSARIIARVSYCSKADTTGVSNMFSYGVLSWLGAKCKYEESHCRTFNLDVMKWRFGL